MAKELSNRTLDDILALIEEQERNRWLWFDPNPKQLEFFAMGASFLERLLHAGNQTGKSEAGAFETSRHLTGLYPPWWKGLRFNKPVKVWVCGPSGTTVRDTTQEKLLGKLGVSLGMGYIPAEAIVGQPTASRSATGAVDTVLVRHASGGISTLVFKTYKQQREDWQGSTVDFIWYDEEPPLDLYIEGQARLFQTGNHSMITFTPLKGMSDVVIKYFEGDRVGDKMEMPDTRGRLQMGFGDCPYITEEMARNILKIYPESEWAARRDGDPYFTQGPVFSSPLSQLYEPSWALVPGQSGVLLPNLWPRLWGLDFGGGRHPFAAVLMAFDRDRDIAHVLEAVRLHTPLALEHSAAIRRIAANVPCAWPHDGHVRDAAGEERASLYRREYQLNMLGTHATHPTGGYSTEGGYNEMEQYMREGRFKVNDKLTDWGNEYRLLHRDEKNQIVRLHDDLMSATRIAFMARRYAVAVPLGSRIVDVRGRRISANTPEAIARRNSFDIFGVY